MHWFKLKPCPDYDVATSGCPARSVPLRSLSCALAIAAVVAGNALADSATSTTASGTSGEPGDMVCGARCVKFLLQWYEKDDTGLIDLVREVQWPDFEAGATLESVDRALRARGICTCPISVSRTATLAWREPALVHLSGDGSTPGHFVVQLPSSTGDVAHVWAGLEGLQTGPTGNFSARRSGAVLLTSREPILHAELAVIASERVPALVIFAFGGAVCTLAAARRWCMHA